MQARPLKKSESERAIKTAIPLWSLGVVETHIRNPERAILVLRMQPTRDQRTGDLWAFSGHPQNLIKSLRHTADALEKYYSYNHQTE